MSSLGEQYRTGTVVQLNRGYPLVRIDDFQHDCPPDPGNRTFSSPQACLSANADTLIRCEHATSLVKESANRAVIGDRVYVRLNEDHDKGIIRAIEPRSTEFVRRDPSDRTTKQVLAANFSLVIIAEPLIDLNYRRLERELVLAHETSAEVLVVLTKNDLIKADEAAAVIQKVRDLAGTSVDVLAVSAQDDHSLDQLREKLASGKMAILIGKSGVGKSTLVNLMAGCEIQETASVRQSDGKGRHTTVDRLLIDLPQGGTIVDMPGIRGLGMWDADQGLSTAFADIFEWAENCRFRDCTHTSEPGCAVRAAISSNELSQARLDSYHALTNELAKVKQQRAEISRIRGEKHRKKRP